MSFILDFLLHQAVTLAIQFGVPYAVNWAFNLQKWGIGDWLKRNVPNLAQMIDDMINTLTHPTVREAQAIKKATVQRSVAKIMGKGFSPADTKGLD